MDDSLQAKADFDDIYTAPDPRAYFRTLGDLDYAIAGEMAPLLRRSLEMAPGPTRRVLDLCCSYGLNGALLRTDLGFAEMCAHYTGDDLDGLSAEGVRRADRELMTARMRVDPPVVRGLDISVPAIEHAVAAGTLSAGWTDDLEALDGEVPGDLAAGIADTGLITCTGGIGYVSERTVSRLLDCLAHPERVWVLCSVLRSVSYEPVRRAVSRHGLVTERVPVAPLRQRRFADDAEAREAVAGAQAWGYDTSGLEDEGWFYAEAWLSRPADDAAALPVEVLAGGGAAPAGRLTR